MPARIKLIVACITAALLVALAFLLTRCDPKVLQIEALMWAENQKPMDFYGKIVDQDNHPVEGVRVTAGVGLMVGPTTSGGKDYYTVSDADGRFSFVGIRGAGSGYTLEKDGYEFDERLPSASRPKDYIPDPNKPVIFPIWKLHGAEPLFIGKVHGCIPCDGSPSHFNILTGKPKGDLEVTLTRSPVNINRGKPFDWTLTLAIANGGFVEITGNYPNEAPEDGYQSKVTVTMSAQDKDWSPDLRRMYYFKNGQTYGRVTINLTTDFQPPPTYFDADIYTNPSGSRNLEFDRSKQINR